MVDTKKFSKPGQRYATPVKTDGLYRFYTSLMKQKPDSQMAAKWCLEHGVFTPKKATEMLLVLEMKQKAVITDRKPTKPVVAAPPPRHRVIARK